MKMNRRNVVVGLGTIVAGGGLALGSGAFSSVEAQRDLEVNVVTGGDIAEEFVDVVLKPDSYGSIGIRGEDGTPVSDLTTLFPKNGDNDYSQDPGFDGTEVSLVDNDVSIVFGANDSDFQSLDALPANSTVTYNNLFEVVNDTGETSDNFDVTFEFSGDSDYGLSFTDPEMNKETVTAGTSTEVGTTTLDTGGDVNMIGTLTIRIE